MFGLKIFVPVQTFRRVPPVRPCNFCHPETLRDWDLPVNEDDEGEDKKNIGDQNGEEDGGHSLVPEFDHRTRIGKKEVDQTLHVIIKLELEDSWSDSTCHNKAQIGRKEVDQTLHVIIKLELEDSWPDSTCHNRARIGSWSKLTCHNRRGRSRGSSLNSSTGTSRQPVQLIVNQDTDCGQYQECVVVFVYFDYGISYVCWQWMITALWFSYFSA